MKNSTKKWKCPICDKRAYDVVVDKYILELMEIDKKADMAKWSNREPPEWFIEGVKQKDAYVRVPLHEVREQFRKVPINGRSKTTRARSLPKL